MLEVIAIAPDGGEVHSVAAPFGAEPQRFIVVRRETVGEFDSIAAAVAAVQEMEEGK